MLRCQNYWELPKQAIEIYFSSFTDFGQCIAFQLQNIHITNYSAFKHMCAQSRLTGQYRAASVVRVPRLIRELWCNYVPTRLPVAGGAVLVMSLVRHLRELEKLYVRAWPLRSSRLRVDVDGWSTTTFKNSCFYWTSYSVYRDKPCTLLPC